MTPLRVAIVLASGKARAAALLLLAALLCPSPALAASDSAPVNVVFQVSEGERQLKMAVFAARRDIRLDPGARIEIVVWNDSVRFLLADPLYDDLHDAIRDLARRGVLIKVCADSLRANNPDRLDLLPQASIVPSGTHEAARLQQRGYAYVRP